MRTLFFDTETFSPTPLRRGVHVYAEQAEIMVAAWAVDDGPIHVEDLTDPGGAIMPSAELLELLEGAADQVVIHNSGFDRTLVRHCWGIDLAVERIHDTLARAMAHSLPGGLEKLGPIMDLGEDSKSEDGQRLIQLFCKPRPKNVKLRRATRDTHPEDWAAFLRYAGQDITAMRALLRKLPDWNYRNTNRHQELNLWRLDQKINDRGFRVDVDLAKAAIRTIEHEQKRLARATRAMTNGEVEKATKRDDLLVHIFTEYGIYLPDLKKDTLERRLDDPELPDALKQLIRVRLATATTSTAKYNALLRSVSSDGILRGTLSFNGALRTGRWAGRLFQPHNLPRPDMDQAAIEEAIEATMADCLDLVTGEVMRALSNILRGLIIARRGARLYCADLEQIESRIAAWLAGEQWKLDSIAAYDRGEGEDNYVMAYSEAFGVTPQAVLEDKKRGGFWRQVGKVMELACGYEGGVGAWLAFASVYRLQLDVLAEDAWGRLPGSVRTQAEIAWDWRRERKLPTFGLSRRVFVVIEAFKLLWRAAHPRIASYWGEMLDAATRALQEPGREQVCRELAFRKRGNWLTLELPSGRRLCYPSPRIEEGQLTYLGVNQYSRKWDRIPTYGGKLFENAVQATARDVMAHNMPAIEDAGFNILLTVHDEVITEAKGKGFTHEMLCDMLATNPPWLPGCPLAAGGFEADRYRKD